MECVIFNHVDDPASALSLTSPTARQALLLGEEPGSVTSFHLLSSAYILGRVDLARLRAALDCLTRQHEALRTVFIWGDEGGLFRRVLRSWKPELIEQSLTLDNSAEPVECIHAFLGNADAVLLRPFERPPAVFIHTQIDPARSVLSILIHEAIADHWSVGVLWREFAEAYETGGDNAPAPSFEPWAALETTGSARQAVDRRLAELADAPAGVELPSDLSRPLAAAHDGTQMDFSLSDEAGRCCDRLAAETGNPRDIVLLAAWTLVVARRAVVAEVVMGVTAANRQDPDATRVVGPCASVLPVRCVVADSGTVRGYLDGIREAVRDARAAGVSFEQLATRPGRAVGDSDRDPLLQVAFAVTDGLIPATLRTADLTLALHEGHGGGTLFDACLRVREWHGEPRLALLYRTGVLRPDEAAALTRALDCTLTELAVDPGRRLEHVRTVTIGQRRRLIELGTGPRVGPGTGVWQLVEDRARNVPGKPAVRDIRAGQALTYRELVRAAAAQSAMFAAAGVREGDRVGVTVRRSVGEIVTVLAIVRLGASYLALEPDVPEAAARQMLDAAGSRVVVGEGDRLARLGSALEGRKSIVIADAPAAPGTDWEVPPAAGPEPSRIAYVGFTSGSTGVPKGTEVPHGAIARLVREPAYLLPGVTDRFLRLAPLGFDLSTLEMFAPLAAGGCVEVYPHEHLVPDDFAEFVKARRITGMWLTAGLFRLVADFRPDAFTAVRQVLTGGDVVPPAQVRRVLDRCPGLRVTNGYGPTENTTFTTVHHVDDPAEVDDPLPIGGPIPGTSLAVLGGDGRLVPHGAIGELYAYGDGLAAGYSGLARETAVAFGHFSPDIDARMYRTGDIVRWDTRGRLRFLGRRDRQVKIRGFRIELEGIARVLRDHPAVRDAVAVAVGAPTGDRRLLAAVVAPGAARELVTELRDFAAERLPGHAVPALWALVEEFPVTANGKLDAARLEEIARHALAPAEPKPQPTDPASAAPVLTSYSIEQVIVSVWRDILGTDEFGAQDRFFDVGGDSLQLLRVAARLRRQLPGHEITVQDLTAHQTISALVSLLGGQVSAGTGERG